MYLLDTNVLIAVMNDRPRQVAEAMADAALRREDLATSSIVLFELRFGIAKSSRKLKNEGNFRDVLALPIRTVDFDGEDAAIASKVRAILESRGTPIGAYDLLIAAQALRHGATLVTANTREFERVAGLKVEDWAR